MASVEKMTGAFRYAVDYTDFRRRARRRIFKGFRRATRFASRLRMGSCPRVKLIASA